MRLLMLRKVIKKTKVTNAGEIVQTGDEIDEKIEEDDLSSEYATQSILYLLFPRPCV